MSMNTTICIYLQDEDTDVWRPVSAAVIGKGLYRITGTASDCTEKWEFKAGDVVRCRKQRFADGEIGIIAFERMADHVASPVTKPNKVRYTFCQSQSGKPKSAGPRILCDSSVTPSAHIRTSTWNS